MAKTGSLTINSENIFPIIKKWLYSDHDIFYRELVSNGCDAITKLKKLEVMGEWQKPEDVEFKITVTVDSNDKTITFTDNGLGMTMEEVDEYINQIAFSGAQDFLEKYKDKANEDQIIGHFGLGFYSAFMVASRVEVTTKKYGEETAYLWSSNAVDGYSIDECEKDEHGTQIVLYLKDNTEDENYDEYLQQYEIERLIKKYSDYIRYPIEMWVESSKRVEDAEGENEDTDKRAEPKYETVKELKTLNSMIPLWKRNKSEITKEEYDEFYKSKFNDYTEPQKVIHTSVEGAVSFTTLMFIPGKAPFNYYSQDYKKGLQLYSRGVFIMDNAEELIPEHFRFVKGLVDSQDLSLNISREMLQHDRQLKVIANRIEKKIKSELLLMLRNDREEYEKFWKNFGLQIKFGVYNDFGANKETLQDLLMFYSSKEQKLVTLDEYINRMEEGQEHIYFMSGDKVELIDNLPQVKKVKEKGYEILYLTDNVDEFALQALMNYKEKTFKNISQGDLDLDSEEEKKELEKKAEENKDLLSGIKEVLGDKVKDVKISSRLVDDPVCLSSEEGMSFEMEKVLSAMPEGNPYGMKASRILEINPKHEIFNALQKVYEQDKDAVKDYADLLYDQALLIEGFPIENPTEFSKKICDFMVKASK